MKTAILFPGIGYHCDKPLLYYSKKILKNEGYEIIEIHFSDLSFDLNKSKDKAYEQAISQLKNVDLSHALFISKSIGTYCAARIAKENNLNTNIYFTPLEYTLEFLDSSDLVYSGTLDQWASFEAIQSHCLNYSIEFHSIENGNHSLETGNILTDISNLKNIMEKTQKFIRTKN